MTREKFVMAVRDDEAEPVVVEVGETEATFVLDDGDRVVFDLVELRAVLADKAAA